MNRRRFLRDLLSGAAALACTPALLHAATGSDGSARFAAGLRQRPWLAGWKSVDSESLGPTAATLQGRLPKGLAGTLYRNGPAWFERDGFRYSHWFDGDGMVHAWRLGDGAVSHRARMVATPKFTREQAAGRFLYPAVGTTIPNALAVRNNDDANVANTSVMVVDGRLFALWEGGSAFELDPDSLVTRGPTTWREDLALAPFSAHPLRERDGTLWNFGSISLLGGSGLLVWRIGKDGRLMSATQLAVEQSAYLHSFAMTDRHLVFVLMPFRRTEGGAFFESLRFAPDLPCKVAVVPKSAPDTAQWFEVDFAAIYHFGDAFERDGRIQVRAVRHTDPVGAGSPMAGAMRGEQEQAPTSGHLRTLHLDLRSGRARWELHAKHVMEFPLFDTRTRGDRPAILYAPTEVNPAVPYFNAVMAFDPERDRRMVHRYGDHVLAEEHVFVPRPGSRRPGQGWLLGTLLDSARGRSGIAVLDAEHVEDGPLAEAWLPYTFPLGFHGTFAG
ncbi:carotenoid oxygenase family protein [Dokdonella koreensis]|uniref:Carotenoid oxygenase n=1 Tax=Dokdonella koreensis DS-123 TaxID=1300342 RepID=A0A160DZB1_9GAMM|nr:carotenoid oxygenase family protein [Dokdonella koreensis]ANB19523.1 Putative carotenoid oxygenase [Dokdonella koreensis DS-123]